MVSVIRFSAGKDKQKSEYHQENTALNDEWDRPITGKSHFLKNPNT